MSTDGGVTWTEVTDPSRFSAIVPAGSTEILVRVPTMDDYLKEGAETLTLSAEAKDQAGTGTGSATGTGSIVDEAPTAEDTVYVRLTGDSTLTEDDDNSLEHTLELVDSSGNLVTLTGNQQVVVNLKYVDDDTNAADYSDVRLSSFTFDAASGSSITLTNSVVNDTLKEGRESYLLKASIASSQGFERVRLDAENSVIGEIIDDISPKPDTNRVQEDGISIATGNVLSNDEMGTGATVSLTTTPADAGNYGSLTLDADGSYTFTLDNGLPAVQALAKGETKELVYEYRLAGNAAPTTLTIAIEGANDAPTLDLSNSNTTTTSFITTFEEGSGAVAIADSSAIVDIDTNDTINSAVVKITNAQLGDMLSAGTLPAGITATLIGSVRIELSGSASRADYQTVIDAITFNNTSATPSEIDRLIEVVVTDNNGLSSNIATTVVEVDATPQAVNDATQVEEGGVTISSSTENLNLLTNDDLGTSDTVMTGFSYKNENGDWTPGSFDTSTTQTVDTLYGSLTISTDGSWSYTSDTAEENLAGVTDTIEYNIRDGNGDESSAAFNIMVSDTSPTALTPEVTVSESDLPNGTNEIKNSLIARHNLNITKDADDIVDVIFNSVTIDTLVALGLTSGGEAVSYEFINDGHTLTAKDTSGETVFTIELNNTNDSTGSSQSFRFTLNKTLDHASDTDVVNLPISYELKDDDSSTTQQFIVNIDDDGVRAVDNAVVEVVEKSGDMISGNVIDNDQGADANLLLNDYTYLDANGDSVTWATFGAPVDTPTGSLTVNEDGNWSFVANKAIDNRDPAPNLKDDGSFSYTLVDADGDISNSATQTIRVTDTAPVVVSDKGVVLKEDELFGSSGMRSTHEITVTDVFSITTNADDIEDIYFTVEDGSQPSFTLSNGTPLYYRYKEVNGEPDLHTIYATKTQAGPIKEGLESDGETVNESENNVAFKVTINPDNNSYVAILYDTIRHPDVDANDDNLIDNAIFNLQYALEDSDGSIVEDSFNLDVENRLVAENLVFIINEADYGDLTDDGSDVLVINVAETFDGGVIQLLSKDFVSKSTITSGQTLYIDVHGKEVAANDPTAVGSVKNIGNGVIEFDPAENYSSFVGDDVSFNVRAQDGGMALTRSVTVKVNPIEDAPIIVIDDAEVSIVDDNYTIYVEEDTSAQLGFKAPIIGDLGVENGTLDILNPDYLVANTGNDDDLENGGSVDRSERLGAITLSGIPDRAELFYMDSDNTKQVVYAVTDTAGSVTITLTDGVHILDSEMSFDKEMTTEQFESLQIAAPANSGTNFDVSMSVTEYEVDENNTPLSTDKGFVTTTATIIVDVQAVTDAPVIDLVGNNEVTVGANLITASIDEDTTLSLQNVINERFEDKDGSERYQYQITGLPEATTVVIAGQTLTAGSNGTVTSSFKTVNMNTDPVIDMTPPQDYAGVIEATLTLITKDREPNGEKDITDKDDSSANIAEQSTSVELELTVNPKHDIEVATPGEGKEDTQIALFKDENGDPIITVTDADGSEMITSVGISKQQVDDFISADGKFIIDINGTEQPVDTFIELPTQPGFYQFYGDSVSGIVDLLDITIVPPAHSSKDIDFTYYVETTDTSIGAGALAQTDGDTFDRTIKVTPVAESVDTDSDGANGNDVTMNPDYTYTSTIYEDGDHDDDSSTAPDWFNLNDGIDLKAAWSNEDQSSLTNGTGSVYTDSEETFARLTVQIEDSQNPGSFAKAAGAQFRYELNGNTVEVTAGKDGIDVPAVALDTLKFIAPPNYAGEVQIVVNAVTIDYDEDDDTATQETVSGESILSMTVTAVADDVLLSVQPARGFEDAGRSKGNPPEDVDPTYIPSGFIDMPENGIPLKIKAQSEDKDDSETFNITIDNLPDGSALYVYDAVSHTYILVAQNYTGAIGSFTLNDADSTDGAWSITLNDYDNSQVPMFIPPSNSSDNYELLVSGESIDGTDVASINSAPLILPIKIATVPDKILNDELNIVETSGLDGFEDAAADSYTLIEEESNLDANNNQIEFKSIFQTPEDIGSYDTDGSEVVTYVITGLDDRFSMIGADVTYLGGAGIARQWVVTKEAIETGDARIQLNEDFAGEINFTVQGISTEQEGGSETTQNLRPVSIFVTSDAADNNVGNPVVTQTENESVVLDLQGVFNKTDSPVDARNGVEALKSVDINVTDLEALGVQLIVDGTPITDTLANSDGFYTIERDADGNLPVVSIQALPDNSEAGYVNHKSGDDVYSFAIKYNVTDTVYNTQSITDPNAAVVYQEETVKDAIYKVNVTAKTDAPEIPDSDRVALETAESINLDTTNGNPISDSFTKTVALSSPDQDGSEKFTRIEVGNVPNGLQVEVDAGSGFVAAIKAGNTWYVDFADEPITDIAPSVDVRFSIKQGYDVDAVTDQPITVTAFNQDAPDTEKSANASFKLSITPADGDTVGNENPDLVANITVDPIVLTEDTADQNLGNFVTGTMNEAAYANNGTRLPLSFTIANLPDDVVLELTDTNLGSLSKQGNLWLISGEAASDSDITNLLSSITISPTNDYSTNNAGETVTLDISLTATDNNGDSETETADPTTSTLVVRPVTDFMDFHTEGAVTTEQIALDEDETLPLTLDLSNTADAGNVVVTEGRIYLKVSDGNTILGELTDTSGMVLTEVTDPAGLAAGTYYVLEVDTNNPTGADFNFMPAANEDGTLNIEAYVVHKESTDIDGYDTGTKVSRKDFEITVSKAPDILTLAVDETASQTAVNEDSAVSIQYNIVQADEDDVAKTFILENVNDDFNVVYFSNGTEKAATKTGIGTWSVPSTSNDPTPEIQIRTPEHFSGVSSVDISVLSDSGLQGAATTVDLTFTAVADPVEMTAQNSAGQAYEWVELNTNIKMTDDDGSETLTLTIAPAAGKPFQDTMLFRIGDDGTVMGLNNASADADGVAISFDGTNYRLTGIPADKVNDIQILSHDYSGEVTYTAQSVETSNDDASAEVVGTANLNLSNSVEINTGAQNDTITGGNGNDVINAGAGDDVIYGKAGNDTINGGEDDDDLKGAEGNDILNGGAGDDTLRGGSGDDYLDGGAGEDGLYGDTDNDTLVFDSANRFMNGGDGVDALLLPAASSTFDFNSLIGTVTNSSLNKVSNIEVLDLSGADFTITELTANAVIQITDENNHLEIDGDNSDSVQLTGNWEQGATSGGYTSYSLNDTTISIDTGITIL
ncbi:VCBS domain-containing protein [Psychrobacter sanguinis]|uniref:VCBS domain-containing protein n=1 Tax=Psychrobacter sanguinis TaxID=861445 RepID=UPI0019564DEC